MQYCKQTDNTFNMLKIHARLLLYNAKHILGKETAEQEDLNIINNI